jgi:1,4-dihydroxy-2-naphthoate octaprenyltransferase
MRSVVQHLRFPFSIFLLPVFLFSISHSQSRDYILIFWAFVVLHIFIYPASNAYNSYFDKDEGPIGGIAHPLPTTKSLYFAALTMDLAGTLLAYWFCSPIFAAAVFVYGLVSKAYSHPSIRLKKYPIASWLTVGLFQGAFVFLAVFQLLSYEKNIYFDNITLFAALLSSLNLMGFYPITQVYQHEEDARRGDITLSLKLGKKGTFIFTAILFLLSTLGFGLYFWQKNTISSFFTYLACMAPALLFFNVWALKVWKKTEEANFQNTMYMNIVGSLCLNVFFLLQIFQAYF